MFINDHLSLHKTRAADMERQAEDYRIAREVLRERKASYRVVGPLLAHMGSRMVMWGTALQRRYGERTEAANPVFKTI